MPGRARYLAYGVSGFPLAMLGIPLFVFLPAFYAEQLGLSLTAVGVIFLLARLFDVFTDPLIGMLSDRIYNPGLRRKLFIVVGAPILLAGIQYLFNPPAIVSISWILVWAMCAYLGWTLISIPYTAWGAELSEKYHERTYIAGSREGFVILGTVAGVVIPIGSGLADDPGAALAQMATILWVSLPICLLVTLVLVPPANKPPSPVRWLNSFKLLRKNRPLKRLLLAYMLNGVANGLPAALFLLFVTNVLGARDLTGLFLGTYFLSGILFLPVWVLLSKRLGKHRTWCVSMVVASAAFCIVPFLDQGDIYLYLAVCLVTGICIGADLALPASIQADVVELDSAASGGNRSGLFFGIWGMATKIAAAVAIGIAFPVLDFSGFNPNAGNSVTALLTLSLLYGAVPVVFKLCSIALMWRFPLDIFYQSRLSEMRNPLCEEELLYDEDYSTAGADAYCSAGLQRHEN